MGTLPIPNQTRLLTRTLPLALVIMIGMQAELMSCSGGMNLARPYLFRDFGMPAGGFSQIAHIYHQKSQQSEEDVGSSEEEQVQYSSPLILEVDDPAGKARWIPAQEESFEDDVEDEEEEHGSSISSTEFRSRSSLEPATTQTEEDIDRKDDENYTGDDSPNSAEKRGMHNFKIINNPLLSFWKNSEDEEAEAMPDQQMHPKSDDPMAYDDGGTYFYPQPYDYDPYDIYDNDEESDQPQPAPMPMKQMPKPKPMQMKPTTQKPKMKQKPKRKPRPPMPPPMMMQKPMKPMMMMREPPPYSQQFHYQQHSDKPGKLAMISDKLSMLNPFRLIQSKKEPQKPPMMMMPSPKSKSKPGKKPPPFVMVVGEPFAEFSADDLKDIDNEQPQNDDEMDEMDDEEDEDEEEEGGGDETRYDQEEDDEADEPVTILHEQRIPYDGIYEDDEVEASPELAVVPSTNTATRSTFLGKTKGQKKEKSSIGGHFVKYLSWGKKKRRPRRPRPRPKPGPARRPPNWKQYEAAPLIPEVVGDTILKIVKNVGILPEYGKDEKYGGHNKIKGKHTKTRPITFHHGLLTEVLRRK